MVAQKADLVADKGSRFTLALHYTNPDGTDVDLTGQSASFMILTRNDEPDVLATVTADTLGSDGWITFRATGSVTELWPRGTWAHRVSLYTDPDDPDFLLIGPVTVRSASDA